MQVATTQAAKALAALRVSRRRGASRRRRQARPVQLASPWAIDRALARIDGLPAVRAGHVAAARARLDEGEVPSAEDVVDMLVRRSVCDGLR
jgi:hypothetical protein